MLSNRLTRFAGALGRPMGLTHARWLGSEARKIPASMIKELKDRTGSPIMDCKKALEDPEVNGDMELATAWLRRRGVAVAEKKLNRAMNDGLIGVLCDPQKKKAFIAEVTSETDFVARNDVFQGIVLEICTTALASEKHGDITEQLMQTKTMSHDSVKAALMHGTSIVGENLGLKNSFLIGVGNGAVGAYIHQKRGDHAGTQAAIVAVEASEAINDEEKLKKLHSFADSLALHAVAAQAKFLSSIPESVAENERAIERDRAMKEAIEKAENSSKTVEEDVLAKRVEKKVEKIMKKMKEEDIFMDQNFLTPDPELNGKVNKAVASMGKTLGVTLSVPLVVRFQIGAPSQAILKPE